MTLIGGPEAPGARPLVRKNRISHDGGAHAALVRDRGHKTPGGRDRDPQPPHHWLVLWLHLLHGRRIRIGAPGIAARRFRYVYAYSEIRASTSADNRSRSAPRRPAVSTPVHRWRPSARSRA